MTAELNGRIRAAEGLCRRINADLDAKAGQRQTADDLQERPTFSYRPLRIEQLGQAPRNEAVECGKVALLRSRRDPDQVVAARLFCKRKACPHCGPRRRQALASHYTLAIGDTPVVGRVIARSAWATTAKKLQRAKAAYVRIPAPQGRYVLLVTAGAGDRVADLAGTLAAAVAAMPTDTARVSSSRCWSATTSGRAGSGDGGWELLGLARVPLAKVIQVAQDLDLYLGPVDARQLAPDWAEAHLLRLPTDELASRRLRRWIGLHWPERHRRAAA